MELTKEQLEKDLRNNVFAYVDWSLDFVDSVEVKDYLCLSPQDYARKEIKEYLEAFDNKDTDTLSKKKIADLYNRYKPFSVSLPYYEELVEVGERTSILPLADIYASLGREKERLSLLLRQGWKDEEAKKEATSLLENADESYLKARIEEEDSPHNKFYLKALLAERYEKEKRFEEAYSIYISEPSGFYSELGLCYLLGKGVRKDIKKAYLHFLKGAKEKPNGHFGSYLVPKKVPASHYLFKAYAKGEYLPKDEKKALMYGDIFMRQSRLSDHYTVSHKEVRYDPDYVCLKKDYLDSIVDKEETVDNLLDKLEVFSPAYFDEEEESSRILAKLKSDPGFNYIALFDDVVLRNHYAYFADSGYKHKRKEGFSERYIYKASHYALWHLKERKDKEEVVDKLIAKAKNDPGYLGELTWPMAMDVSSEIGKEKAKNLYKTLLPLDYVHIQRKDLDAEFEYEEQWLFDYLGVKE